MHSVTSPNSYVTTSLPGPYKNSLQPFESSSRTTRTDRDPRVKSQLSSGIPVMAASGGMRQRDALTTELRLRLRTRRRRDGDVATVAGLVEERFPRQPLEHH